MKKLLLSISVLLFSQSTQANGGGQILISGQIVIGTAPILLTSVITPSTTAIDPEQISNINIVNIKGDDKAVTLLKQKDIIVIKTAEVKEHTLCQVDVNYK